MRDLCGTNCVSRKSYPVLSDSFPPVRSHIDVNTWEYNEFEDPADAHSLPLIIPLEAVQCQISRGTLEYTDPPMWITTTMDRVNSTSFTTFDIGGLNNIFGSIQLHSMESGSGT
jgi:hypothetical protein